MHRLLPQYGGIGAVKREMGPSAAGSPEMHMFIVVLTSTKPIRASTNIILIIYNAILSVSSQIFQCSQRYRQITRVFVSESGRHFLTCCCINLLPFISVMMWEWIRGGCLLVGLLLTTTWSEVGWI